MRTLRSIYHLFVKSYTDEGTFCAAAERLAGLCALGFDAVAISAFDDTCGSSQQLLSLVARAHALGLCVVLDLACLYGGVTSPASFIEMAVRQSLADGFLLGAQDLRFDDVLPTIGRLHKERDDLWFGLCDRAPIEGERPDGIARLGFEPSAILTAAQPADELSRQLARVAKTRMPLVTPVPYRPEQTLKDHAAGDAALLLAYLLPGVPHLAAGCESASHATRPTDAQAFADRRRYALLTTLCRLRSAYATLSSTHPAARIDLQDGTLILSRRTDAGTLYLYLRVGTEAGCVSDRPLAAARPLLSSGLYRRGGLPCLSPYGYALCFVEKVQKTARIADAEQAHTDEVENSTVGSVGPDSEEMPPFMVQNAGEMQTIL